MEIIRKEIPYKSRSQEFRIIPLGDVHLGAQACDENLFRKTVKYIDDNDNIFWIGMGDYCDFINVRDPRFSIDSLADWLITKDTLGDISKAQRDKFLEITKPIAHKCLGLLEGNHERTITKYYERAIYNEIVAETKVNAGMDVTRKLGLGYYGWLQLMFKRKSSKMKEASTRTININLHHGFVGGKLAGAKALNMQRWLWSHDADLVIFGHSHNTSAQSEQVERLSQTGELELHIRKGCYGGTFLKSVEEGVGTYSEMKGYFPLPVGGVEILIRPGAVIKRDVLRIIT